jgi:hypothetical protein
MNNNASTQNGYLLLFRGNAWHKGLSAEEIQTVTSEWKKWFDRWTEKGKVKGGQPLKAEGKLVSGKQGRVVADGPFAESKETIGGYFLLDVGTMDEALAIARECPGLPYGAVVEVRPIAERCTLADEAGVEYPMATATA